jgi:XTP/dITP diphosphohydrolase
MKLLIATTNQAKARELIQIMSGLALECITLGEIGIANRGAVEETGSSFAENALLKARYYRDLSGLITVADDSGLEVEALGGRPGLRSARFAGPRATDALRISKLLTELKAIPDDQRQARFVCAAAVVWAGGERVFIGNVRGRILHEPHGNSGFGYDPVFYYEPLRRTFGEMTREEKSQVSHRAMAFRQLATWLSGALDTPLVTGDRIDIPTREKLASDGSA